MDSISQNIQEQIFRLLRPSRVCLMRPVILHDSNQSSDRSADRFLVLTLWRGYLVKSNQPIKVESTFSYMEICCIRVHSQTQLSLETDRQTLSFSVLHMKDAEAMISHITTSLKKVFPDSSPGKLLKIAPQNLQQRLFTLTDVIEEQLNSQPSCCGGFSETYAALCDFNEMPFRKEILWDIDNIYHNHNWRQFNLHDFSHLDSRDLALAIAAISVNQWFTKISCKDLRLSEDVQQQLTFLLSTSSSLQELSLQANGLKLDFAVKMAAALQENTSSPLQSINLSGNPIEDKGVIALSQELKSLHKGLKQLCLSQVSMTARGLGCLSKALASSQLLSATLTHLDLSGNPNCLVTEEATFLFKFLSSTNSLFHLDLRDTNCPLDTLFVSLSAGRCFKLVHLNLARNPFSHRKVQEVTRSIQEFFSQSQDLKYVGLSATQLPPQALRLLLQGLAINTCLVGLELDISSCELHSAGAQVIQEHISEAAAISSLDISNNSFENDMVTLVLAFGRCQSLRCLSLGRNFTMKSRALTDVLHRIAQLIQDKECCLQSLSVCDSKLKTGTHILLNALGGAAALTELDISGNSIGDSGAKMLAKALMNNTKLRTLKWDRNNVTARGFQDVADALERNFTLQRVSLPLADLTHSYRSSPERTEEALHKIQFCLDRNNQRQSDSVELMQQLQPQESKKVLDSLCQQVQDSLQCINPCNGQEVQTEVRMAQEVLQNAAEAFKLLPTLHEAGSTSTLDEDRITSVLADTAALLTEEFTTGVQKLAESLMRSAETACPWVVQRSVVYESLSECVSRRGRQANIFLRSTLVESTGRIISNKLRELRQRVRVVLAESIVEQLLHDLTVVQDTLSSPAYCRNTGHSTSLKHAASPEVHYGRIVDSNGTLTVYF